MTKMNLLSFFLYSLFLDFSINCCRNGYKSCNGDVMKLKFKVQVSSFQYHLNFCDQISLNIFLSHKNICLACSEKQTRKMCLRFLPTTCNMFTFYESGGRASLARPLFLQIKVIHVMIRYQGCFSQGNKQNMHRESASQLVIEPRGP